MFGFSLQKLLLLAAIIAAVWYGFKFVARLQDARDADAGKSRRPPRRAAGARTAKRAGGDAAEDVEDMVQCPVCDAYVPARSASNCGRADCPY